MPIGLNFDVTDEKRVHQWFQIGRPVEQNDKTGEVRVLSERGFAVNSLLSRDEWVEMDGIVLQAARPILRMVNELRSRNLTHPLGGLGSLVSRYTRSSEVTRPSINMSGRGSNRDLPEMDRVDIPIPIIWKDCEIDLRGLLASRRMGDGIDVTAITEFTQVIAEEAERLILGLASVGNFNGIPLYGLLTHPDRNTLTATGDWGTITNILPTISAGMAALRADLHYGQVMIYISENQYAEAAEKFYDDGTGNTPLERILKIPNVLGVEPVPYLPDGTLVMVRMTRDVLDYAEPRDFSGVQLREWTTNDGMATGFKLMMVGAPRIKSKWGGKSGIVHITGA